MCKEQIRCHLCFSTRVCNCSLQSPRRSVQLGLQAAGTSPNLMCMSSDPHCSPRSGKRELGSVESFRYKSTWHSFFSSLYGVDGGVLWGCRALDRSTGPPPVSELRSCRVSGIPASGRFGAAAGKSLHGYPEIERSPSRRTHKLVLVSVCAADRGFFIWAAEMLGADYATNVVVGVIVLGVVEICAAGEAAKCLLLHLKVYVLRKYYTQAGCCS